MSSYNLEISTCTGPTPMTLNSQNKVDTSNQNNKLQGQSQVANPKSDLFYFDRQLQYTVAAFDNTPCYKC